MSHVYPGPPDHTTVTNLIARADIQFDESKPLGQGEYGAVFKGVRKSGSRVAVKRLLQGLTAQSRAEFRQEVAIMCKMRSEFVVQVYGIVDDSPDQPVLLIMELMHESLHSAYSSMPPPTLWQRMKWLVEAGKGIAFLHEQSVLHRDIKPGNMLISSPDTSRFLKLCDFGLSKSLADTTSTSLRTADPSSALHAVCGTLLVASAHLITWPRRSFPSNLSSVLHRTSTLLVWFVGRSFACSYLSQIVATCRNSRPVSKVTCVRARGISRRLSPAIRTLIERAWHQDPSKRPSIQEVIRDLEQFLGQLQPDAQAAVVRSPHSSGRAAPDSRMPALNGPLPSWIAAPVAEHPPPRPVDSSIVDAKQLSLPARSTTLAPPRLSSCRCRPHTACIGARRICRLDVMRTSPFF
jgi:serine/threonine protein kinase